MSYFLFGAFEVPASAHPRDEDGQAWQLSRTASAAGLHALLGGNVWPQPVREMLGQKGLVGPGHLAFLLTSSPTRNTSEELVSPFQVVPSDFARTEDALSRASRWIDYTMRTLSLPMAHLLLTEGFDDSFAELHVPSDAVTAQVMRRVMEIKIELPSMHLRVTRSGHS